MMAEPILRIEKLKTFYQLCFFKYKDLAIATLTLYNFSVDREQCVPYVKDNLGFWIPIK